MPLILAYVSVTDAELGTLKQIHNVVHTVGADLRHMQVAGIGDPEDSTAVAKVDNAPLLPTVYGIATRDVPPNWDSGLLAVPAVITSIQASDLKVKRLFLMNKTNQVQQVSVTDGVGEEFLTNYGLAAGGFLSLDLGGLLFDGGLKWMAAVAGTVNGQVLGDI